MIEPLRSGPLDIVGDVHGEVDVLRTLLGHLGYDAAGRHRDGRSLVFVGDLCDRGQDSPAVFAFVNDLVESGRAQCVLGNHELNLMRKEQKDGNDWYFERASAAECAAIQAFLGGLPVALEREDLRIVHACWHEPSVSALDETGRTVIDTYRDFEAQTEQRLAAGGLKERALEEASRYAAQLEDRDTPVPMLHALAESDEIYQMGNPIRVLTSGLERRTSKPFFAGGKWRFVERVRWWNEYEDHVPVVIGHYWRWRDPAKRAGKAGPDLFEGTDGHEWLGPARNVFCVDFSVGHRHTERQAPPHEHKSRLAALRWPERTLVFDDGHGIATA